MATLKVKATSKPTKRQSAKPVKRTPKITALLDAFLTAKANAANASKRKSEALTEFMSVTEHGQTVKASDGTLYAVVNTKTDVKQSQKVLDAILASDDFSPKQKRQIETWITETMSERSQRDVKKLG